MKKNIVKLAMAASVLLAACQKEKLDPIPQTSLSDAVAFATPDRALQQVNGLYSALKNGQMYGGRYLNYQDARGEEFLNVTNNGVTNLQTWNFTVNSNTNEVVNFWAAVYACINRCNVVIDGLSKSPIAANLRAQYIAEAKVVRATCYFMLQQMFARPYTDGNGSKPGVILRLTPEASSGNNSKARATTAEVYAQILKDLNEAETDLPSTYSSAELRTTRAHKNTAIALKTRVYLAMGQYGSVVTEGNKIVPNAAPWTSPNNAPNALQASIATVFSTYTNAEAILSMPFTALDLPGTQNSPNSYYNPGPNGNGDYELNTTGNGIVANADWKTADARRAFNQVTGTRTYLRKWPKNAGSDPDWVIVIRYSEVMLNLAEALARQNAGVDARAVALLNAIRQRSDASTTFAPVTKDELINLILTERRIELLGEGFRTSDISRLGLPYPAKGSVQVVPVSASQYIWPISNNELITNPDCKQNDGY